MGQLCVGVCDSFCPGNDPRQLHHKRKRSIAAIVLPWVRPCSPTPMPSSKWMWWSIKLAVLGHSRGGHLFGQRALPSLANDWIVTPVTQSRTQPNWFLPQVSTVVAGESSHRNQGGIARIDHTTKTRTAQRRGVTLRGLSPVTASRWPSMCPTPDPILTKKPPALARGVGEGKNLLS